MEPMDFWKNCTQFLGVSAFCTTKILEEDLKDKDAPTAKPALCTTFFYAAFLYHWGGKFIKISSSNCHAG